MENTV